MRTSAPPWQGHRRKPPTGHGLRTAPGSAGPGDNSASPHDRSSQHARNRAGQHHCDAHRSGPGSREAGGAAGNFPDPAPRPPPIRSPATCGTGIYRQPACIRCRKQAPASRGAFRSRPGRMAERHAVTCRGRPPSPPQGSGLVPAVRNSKPDRHDAIPPCTATPGRDRSPIWAPACRPVQCRGTARLLPCRRLAQHRPPVHGAPAPRDHAARAKRKGISLP